MPTSPLLEMRGISKAFPGVRALDDVSLAIQKELYLEFREPGFSPAPLLEHLVTAGYLGRKTKRGFRDYSVR